MHMFLFVSLLNDSSTQYLHFEHTESTLIFVLNFLVFFLFRFLLLSLYLFPPRCFFPPFNSISHKRICIVTLSQTVNTCVRQHFFIIHPANMQAPSDEQYIYNKWVSSISISYSFVFLRTIFVFHWFHGFLPAQPPLQSSHAVKKRDCQYAF